jgi:general secretion pathway protein D
VVNLRLGVGAYLAFALVGALLGGCDPVSLADKRPHLPDPFDAVQNTNLDPRFPEQVAQPSSTSPVTTGASFYGQDSTGAATVPGSPAASADNGEGYQLNFENASVASVAKVILGDILGAGFTIDPRVQGTVTISSGRPVPKSQLIPVLESVLRMSNVVLVARNGEYQLIPAGDAQGESPSVDAKEPGYGISVVPLRYTSAQNILKVLDSFATKPGMARADAGHNLILVQGTGPERQAAVDTILNFDVDWMRGQSVGIYPLENASPEEMIKELERIMETGDGGLNEKLATFQPVQRLNAVLVVTKKPNLLKQAASWISRLDKANNAGASVHVYRLRYGDARQIARVLGDLFGARQQGLESAANQIAPGSSATTASSGATTTNGVAGVAGTQTGGGLGGGAAGGIGSTSGGGGSFGSSLGGGATGGAAGGGGGIQLGNLGAGFGNSQSLGGAGAGGSTSNIGAGAFGGAGGQGTTGVNLPGVRIAADVTNNSLVIFASQENYRLIEQTLVQLDRPQLQVAIHATIAEVTLNNDLQFGVEYYLQGNNSSVGFNTQGSGVGAGVSQVLGAVLPGANLMLGPQGNPRVVINALRNITDVKVLSSPSVVVLDNQLATLLVGDQVPVETQSANVLAATTAASSTVVNSINYINTGVILRVLPRVNANGTVILDVEQEVSGVVGNGAATTLTPTVSQRQVKSSIAVASGQTVLLGGLISETQQRTRLGVPVLEEIPAIGNLFSTNDRSTTRTEIIIFIEPQIIRNSVDASKVAQELRAKLRGSDEKAFQPGPALRSDPHFAQ